MIRRENFFFVGFGRKKAFTLLELMLALAIGSLLMAVLGNILLTSLNTSAGLGRKMTRTNDEFFALQSLIDEIHSADAFYFIEDNGLQLYVREKGRNGHKVVSYVLQNRTLSRYGDYYRAKYSKEKIGKRPGVRNIILDDVKELHFSREGDLLTIRLTRGGREYTRSVALRDGYD